MDAALRSIEEVHIAKKLVPNAGSKAKSSSSILNSKFVKGTGYGGGPGGLSKVDIKRTETVKIANSRADKTMESAFHTIARDICAEYKLKLSGSNSFFICLHSLLRNDSLFDISERGGLYRALLELLSALAQEPFLASLLNSHCRSDDGDESPDTILSLLNSLATQAVQFVRLHQGSANGAEDTEDSGPVEQALLMALHVEAASAECSLRVQQAQAMGVAPSTSSASTASCSSSSSSTGDRSTAAAAEKARKLLEEQEYLRELRPLRFEAVPLLEEIQAKRAAHCLYGQTGKSKLFSSSTHPAAASSSSSVASTSRGWTARVAAEMSGLMSSLPVYPASAVFVRCDEARMDVVKALVVAPEGTPYANGCFEFDILLPPTYPQVPPKVLLCTTGKGTVRFNPNLYNCGKVCLSLLGTWQGPGWEPGKSTLLQVLVSIQSLIFVEDPYFNEPGYERSMGTPAGKKASKQYNDEVRRNSARHAILAQLKNPSPIFKDVIQKHFRIKRETVLRQLREWAKECPVIKVIEKEIASALQNVAAPIVIDDEGPCVPSSQSVRVSRPTDTAGTNVCVDLCSDDEDDTDAVQRPPKRQKSAPGTDEVIYLD